jgi:hypothetical protein
MKHLKIILTQVCAMLAVFFAMEGQAYIHEGWGVHPVGAGFMLALCLGIPHLIGVEDE